MKYADIPLGVAAAICAGIAIGGEVSTLTGSILCAEFAVFYTTAWCVAMRQMDKKEDR